MKNINESEIEKGKNDKREYIYIYMYICTTRVYYKKDTNRFSFLRFSLND